MEELLSDAVEFVRAAVDVVLPRSSQITFGLMGSSSPDQMQRICRGIAAERAIDYTDIQLEYLKVGKVDAEVSRHSNRNANRNEEGSMIW